MRAGLARRLVAFLAGQNPLVISHSSLVISHQLLAAAIARQHLEAAIAKISLLTDARELVAWPSHPLLLISLVLVAKSFKKSLLRF